jgi:hypothetical protein
MISRIQFECDIKNNKCARYRNIILKDGKEATSCCCDCRENRGYINAIRFGDAEYYNNLFDERTGFLRDNVGCILPLSKRSVFCVCYYCDYIKEKLSPQQLSILNLVGTGRG